MKEGVAITDLVLVETEYTPMFGQKLTIVSLMLIGYFQPAHLSKFFRDRGFHYWPLLFLPLLLSYSVNYLGFEGHEALVSHVVGLANYLAPGDGYRLRTHIQNFHQSTFLFIHGHQTGSAN